MTERERLQHEEKFYKNHQKAALAWCKRHKSDPKMLKCVVNEDHSVSYTHNGTQILTANSIETMQTVIRFTNKTDRNNENH